jgi:hypothetical protein
MEVALRECRAHRSETGKFGDYLAQFMSDRGYAILFDRCGTLLHNSSALSPVIDSVPTVGKCPTRCSRIFAMSTRN